MAGAGGLSPEAAAVLAQVEAGLPEGRFVVALSGGADSAVLAWAVSQCSPHARALSVDHGLAGSPRLMTAAVEIAETLGLAHEVVPAESSESSETALRSTRYSALERAADSGEIVLTGHTLDDQAETVLGNVLRGTGTAGLGGIPAARGRFVRPLLAVSRSEVRHVAAELGLPFADDPQNSDLDVRRNHLRRETIPRLAARFNPRLVSALARLAASALADDDVLEDRAAGIPVTGRDGAVIVPAAYLATLPMAVAARVARRAIREARGPHAGTADEVGAVLGAVEGTSTTIGGGVDVLREGPWVVLVTAKPHHPPEVEIEVGREVEFGDWLFRAEDGSQSVGRFGVTLGRPRRLAVRTALADERIAITGGTKRVGDALAEAGVPDRMRPVWPVIDADGTIAWIAGVRAAPAPTPASGLTVRARRRS